MTSIVLQRAFHPSPVEGWRLGLGRSLSRTHLSMYIEAVTRQHPDTQASSILDRLIGRRHEQIYTSFINTIEEDENKKGRTCSYGLEAANEVECGIAAGLSYNMEWEPYSVRHLLN